ncbi:MAG: 2-amino-4-hydroxy-6-hydroxymethyldihydropteridine diphosphokinase [Deltaproteobacteria bacterium]|nr:2-amino-4-hydroxy-6-hydroxymethyldihydropteridine diphosphokinase [Deltaproteobacteria bacterium]
MSRVYLSLGSNIGNRQRMISEMLRMLDESPDVRILRASSDYETRPVGMADQPMFVNIAVAIETELDPMELLALCKMIEGRLGRVDRGRWGPREADMDVVFYEDLVADLPELKLPHPETHLRRFVLEPLCEIAPGAVHPVLKKTVKELLSDLGDADYVIKTDEGHKR